MRRKQTILHIIHCFIPAPPPIKFIWLPFRASSKLSLNVRQRLREPNQFNYLRKIVKNVAIRQLGEEDSC